MDILPKFLIDDIINRSYQSIIDEYRPKWDEKIKLVHIQLLKNVDCIRTILNINPKSSTLKIEKFVHETMEYYPIAKLVKKIWHIVDICDECKGCDLKEKRTEKRTQDMFWIWGRFVDHDILF